MDAKFVLSLATSLCTLATMWLVGRKDWRGWIMGLFSQCVWGVFILTFKAWGLIPLSVSLTLLYIKNLIVWRKEDRE